MATCRRRRRPRRSRSTASMARGPRPGRCEPGTDDGEQDEEDELAAVEVNVPDIGYYKDVPVLEVLVKPGDVVAKDDSLVTLESDKATMDVPAPSAGKVAEVRVKVGDKVSEGSAIVMLEGEAAGKAPATPPAPP